MEQKLSAIIVGVKLNNQQSFSDQMSELRHLAEACDIEVIEEFLQNMEHVNPAHYLGKGKLQELSLLASEKKPDMVIFNDELSGGQIRNLEEALKCRIVDRTALILDIFSIRAKTREAKLQVEIAKLQYDLPRLVGSREYLGRQGGGTGLINRGSGETRLEADRRKIGERISGLQKELEILAAHRKIQRKRRKKEEIPVVALVGYTNSGKSTIMNAMLELFNQTEGKQVFEKDMLFATLQTSVRNIKLPDNKSFLLTDTVGFISKLPHQLVKAFRSTLEEVTEADVLIHVVDYSNPNYKHQMEVTNETLKELGAENIPVIYAYNKIDLVEGEIPETLDNSVYISAKKRTGIDNLVEMICSKALKQYFKCELLIPYDKGGILSYLKDNANILSTEYKNDGALISLECREEDFNRYKRFEYL